MTVTTVGTTSGTGDAAPSATVGHRTVRLSALTGAGDDAGAQAAAVFARAGEILREAGLGSSDVVQVVEYAAPEALAGYAGVDEARSAFFGDHAPVVATVAVEGVPGPGALLSIEVTAYPGGGDPVLTGTGGGALHRGLLRIADDIVYLPSVHPYDADGPVRDGDFRGQYRYCLERTAELLDAAGLGLDALVQTFDYTATATRDQYPRCGRPRKELLGGTGTDGARVHPGAAGLLVDRPVAPGAMVSLDCTASRAALRAVNPGWRRYETLTYKPGVAAGNTLFGAGFGALEPATQKAIFDGDLLAQAEFTYASIVTMLREAGVPGTSVVRLVEYVLPDALEDYPKVAELRRTYFGDPGPAVSTAVVTALLRPEFLIETIPTAVLPCTC